MKEYYENKVSHNNNKDPKQLSRKQLMMLRYRDLNGHGQGGRRGRRG